MEYLLYSDDARVASFVYARGTIQAFRPEKPALLPMQIRDASAEMFALWLQDRAIDLTTLVHRKLMQALVGSRDRVAVAIATNMFSITDAFTCFPEGEFVPRDQLWSEDAQDAVSDFVLVSSDTSLRLRTHITPNASTDGSFPKTWKYEKGEWWLYKIQSAEATNSEYAIARALNAVGWDAAVYARVRGKRTRIRTRNFVGAGEFFEPYDSLRYCFSDRRDRDAVIYANIGSMGAEFERAFRRILLADALFMNADRHMRNFGVIRSSGTGEILRLAPNFDNNQAYKAIRGVPYSPAMLRLFEREFGLTGEDRDSLRALIEACGDIAYLADARAAAMAFLG